MNEENLPQESVADIELLKQRDTYQYQIALKNIEATAQNSREIREHFSAINLRGLWLLCLITLCLLAFSLYALYLGKEEIISDILKVLVGALGGGGIGYAIGIKRNSG